VAACNFPLAIGADDDKIARLEQLGEILLVYRLKVDAIFESI
jgi:hypothetical protein